MSENLRDQLQEKYDSIIERLKELELIKTTPYKTSCQFRYNPINSYSTVSIGSCVNLKDLIDVNAFIQTKSEQYENSAKQLELLSWPQFTWCGYTSDLWFHDIKLRISVLGLEKEIQKLTELKNKISPYLPETNKIKQLLLELNEKN